MSASAPIGEARPAIICFAGDIWDANPHSRHHLMRRFARDFDVLFIEAIPMRSLARGEAFELRRALRKLRAGSALREVAPGLHVLRPFPIPPAGRLGRALQLAALRAQIKRACRRCALGEPRIAWFSTPNVAPLRGELGETGAVFYYQDRYDAFSHVDADWLRAHVAELARGCEVTIASAEGLADDLRALGADPLVVPHGVDVDRFAGEHQPPAELESLERPLVGFAGILDDYLELDCLRAVADRLDTGTVVVVGPANIDTAALAHPRIRLLGRRPYDEMPRYIGAFDCALVPFAHTRLTAGVNPIKLREYLAAGRPVVSTALPEVMPYADVVELADDPEEFAAAVVRALAPENDTAAARERRRARVAGESWDKAASRIEPSLRALAGLSTTLAEQHRPMGR